MPWVQSPTFGLLIQTEEQVRDELIAAHQTLFGSQTPLGDTTFFRRVIDVFAKHEVAMQEIALAIQTEALSKAAGKATDLDRILALVGDRRRGSSASKSSAGLAVGDGVFLPNDSTQVSQASDGTVWSIVDGEDEGIGGTLGYTLSLSGTPVTIESTVSGDKTFASGDAFSISTPVIGWDSFSVSRDIELYETGLVQETDVEAVDRNAVVIYQGGDDISAIRARVADVIGVRYVQVYENRSCSSTNTEGLPPGTVEVVVLGGEDLEIAQAILDRLPTNVGTHGDESYAFIDYNGQPITISFSRPTPVPIWVRVTISTTTAEGSLPESYEEDVTAAVLAFAQANTAVGQDVIYQQFIGPVFSVIYDPESESFATTLVSPRVSNVSALAVAEANIPIGQREIADYDSSRIAVGLT